MPRVLARVALDVRETNRLFQVTRNGKTTVILKLVKKATPQIDVLTPRIEAPALAARQPLKQRQVVRGDVERGHADGQHLNHSEKLAPSGRLAMARKRPKDSSVVARISHNHESPARAVSIVPVKQLLARSVSEHRACDDKMSFRPSSTIIAPNASIVPGRQSRQKGVGVQPTSVEQVPRWCPPCCIQ
eukprot:9494911-Pyramimonas_sp.AAC.1